jgi:hypothetical protein
MKPSPQIRELIGPWNELTELLDELGVERILEEQLPAARRHAADKLHRAAVRDRRVDAASRDRRSPGSHRDHAGGRFYRAAGRLKAPGQTAPVRDRNRKPKGETMYPYDYEPNRLIRDDDGHIIRTRRRSNSSSPRAAVLPGRPPHGLCARAEKPSYLRPGWRRKRPMAEGTN